MRRSSSLPCLCAFALVALAAVPSRGDLVIGPEPSSTTTPCPPGHLPRTTRGHAYCEPPPDKPCPKGSHWSSTSATDTSCRAHRRCDRHRCGSRAQCVETSFCLEERSESQRVVEIAHGTCESEADCQAPTKCVKAGRCTPLQAPDATTTTTPSAAPPAATSDAGAGSPAAAGPPAHAGNGCSGCTLTPRGEGRDGMLALTALLLLARRRRLRACR